MRSYRANICSCVCPARCWTQISGHFPYLLLALLPGLRFTAHHHHYQPTNRRIRWVHHSLHPVLVSTTFSFDINGPRNGLRNTAAEALIMCQSSSSADNIIKYLSPGRTEPHEPTRSQHSVDGAEVAFFASENIAVSLEAVHKINHQEFI